MHASWRADDVVFVPFGSFARVVDLKLLLPIDAYMVKDKALSVTRYSKAWNGKADIEQAAGVAAKAATAELRR